MFHVEVEQMKVDLPEMDNEHWMVEKFTVSKKDSDRTKISVVTGPIGRGFVPPGTYTRLREKKIIKNLGTWMSDTPAECIDLLGFVSAATGNVLVAGLGMGVVIKPLMENPQVKSVTVIEKDPTIFEFIGSVYLERYPEKLKIINADIFNWKPDIGVKFDYAWYDIWLNICADNIDEMQRLKRRFREHCAKHDFWCYHECLRLQQIGY